MSARQFTFDRQARIHSAIGLLSCFLCLLSGVLHAEESDPKVPDNWRVILYGGSRRSKYEFILDSTGRVVEPRKNRIPKQSPVEYKLDAAGALAGLHLVWAALEDAPLKTGKVHDAEFVRVTIETDHWRWSRHWDIGEGEKTDPRLLLFRDFVVGRKQLEAKSIRTRHLTPQAIAARWEKEWKKLRGENPYYSWDRATWRSSLKLAEAEYDFWLDDKSQGLRNFDKSKGAVADVAMSMSDTGELDKSALDVMEDFLVRSAARHPQTGKIELEMTLSIGGGHTILSLLGLDRLSEAGPNAEKFFSKAHAALDKDRRPEPKK